jgi:magnesium transporter
VGEDVPVIVDCAVYEDGVRQAGTFTPSEAYAQGCLVPGRFVWIGLFEPTEEEFAQVTQEFHLAPLAVEDAIEAHERPKIEEYDESVFVVFKTVWLDPENETVEVGQMMIFLGEHFVVTVRHGQTAELKRVRRELERDPERLAWGPTSVLYGVTDRIVDLYDLVADEMDVVIDAVEQEVFTRARSGQAERIFRLRREILDLRRAIVPLLDPIDRLAKGKVILIEPKSATYFRDIHDHLLRASEQVDKSDSLLSSALAALAAQVGMQQNEDMRKISAWVAILAVPTAIAGIYGMNFDNMPELRSEFGYFGVLGVMGVVCLVLYLSFRHRGWLGPTDRAPQRPRPRSRPHLRRPSLSPATNRTEPEDAR